MSSFCLTKVYSVRFFALQKFVVSAFLLYKSLQCPHFCFTKVCTVHFFASENFVVSAFLPYKSL
jgi:hypothetical protein